MSSRWRMAGYSHRAEGQARRGSRAGAEPRCVVALDRGAPTALVAGAANSDSCPRNPTVRAAPRRRPRSRASAVARMLRTAGRSPRRLHDASPSDAPFLRNAAALCHLSAAARCASPTLRRAPNRAHAPVLTVTEAVATALQHQPDGAPGARGDRRGGRAGRAGARGSTCPQLNVTGLYQRTTGNFSPRPGAHASRCRRRRRGATKTYDYYSFGVNAQPAHLRLRADHGARAGRGGHPSRRPARVGAGDRVGVAVRRAPRFFQARAQKALCGVAQETLANQQSNAPRSRGWSGGHAPGIDLARARTDVANARVAMIAPRTAWRRAARSSTRRWGVPRGPSTRGRGRARPLPARTGRPTKLVDARRARAPGAGQPGARPAGPGGRRLGR